MTSRHELIFQAWRCVLGDARATYLSGPITTGLRWVEAVEQGSPNAARSEVIAENGRQLIRIASQLRESSKKLVIEPASLNVLGWRQADYLMLWTGLIEQHVEEVRFLNDWYYSNGCAHEFERAVRHRIPTLDLEGRPISQSKGLAQLRDARDKLRSKQDTWPALKSLYDGLGAVVARLQSAA